MTPEKPTAICLLLRHQKGFTLQGLATTTCNDGTSMDVATKMEVLIYTPENKHLPILQKRVLVQGFFRCVPREWMILLTVSLQHASEQLLSKLVYKLSSWWFQPLWKIFVEMGIFPIIANNKYLKPPPSYVRDLQLPGIIIHLFIYTKYPGNPSTAPKTNWRAVPKERFNWKSLCFSGDFRKP